MTTQEVADRLVELCAAGNFEGATEVLYSPDIVSLETGAPPGANREAKGIDAVLAKGRWWADNHEVHSVSVEGPLVAGAHFTAVFRLDITFKPTGQRHVMEEVAVYKVAEGKVVYEEFFYSM